MLIEQLLHGLESRDMCDETIAKKPATFKVAFEVAHTLEATRNTAKEVRTARPSLLGEATNKLGYERPKTRKTNLPSHTQNNQKQQWSDQQSSEQRVCGGCGGNHNRSQCKFRDAKCFNSERKGHISKVCRSSTQNPQDRSTAQIHSEAILASLVDVIQPLSKIHSINTCGKQVIHVTIDGHSMDMEVDTGAPCGIISEKKLRVIKPIFTLVKSDRQFSSYTGHRIRCLGRLPVNVSIGSTTRKLNLYVVAEDYDTLFGREWISQFAIEVNLNELFTQSNTVHSLASTSSKISMDQQQALSQLLANYDDVFGDTAGMLKGPPASVHLKPGTTPVFAKARDVPLALKSKYTQEIDKKLAAGFYERVDYSEWASTAHIVVKKNGNLRITGGIFRVECRESVCKEEIKLALILPQVLMPYDPNLPLILATDASKFGLGSVLSHRLENGRERLIAYASCSMSATEQRYPQIDKEALAIVWAVKKFFNYLYARRFTLITDHKPLTQILHPTKSLPILCISRIANYADYLSHFNFDVVYKSTKENVNADYCSRIVRTPRNIDVNKLSVREGRESEGDGFEVFVLHQIAQLPVRAEHIGRETRKDPILGKIVQLLEAGADLTRFDYKAPEVKYTLSATCLLFEHRVVIPPVLRQSVLNDLHVSHLGIVKMKGIARSFVYWPGIDTDIEKTAKSCAECARQAHAPSKFSEHHWQYPKGPWERIHIDYAGPVAGSMLLIIVDAYSKWLEVKVTNSMTTAATIGIIDELFSRYGAPVTIVSERMAKQNVTCRQQKTL
ncbi:uncharacterized protein K02A2.6-like [Topomyia yanbarensis]|uniref:uncharacterized protein K02A2.6-like n=1 Tax=Topomyia yanbarensis TaxID=2498891 RepID=UPI00273CF2D5|nr:uncharacterized protein K02A2.6-like [Topomyia yanbarensis]